MAGVPPCRLLLLSGPGVWLARCIPQGIGRVVRQPLGLQLYR